MIRPETRRPVEQGMDDVDKQVDAEGSFYTKAMRFHVKGECLGGEVR